MFTYTLLPWAKRRLVAISAVLILTALVTLLFFVFHKSNASYVYNDIPIPFVSANGMDYLHGSVTYFGQRNGIDIFEVTFNNAEFSERFLPDRIYLVHIPNSPSIRDVPLDVAMAPVTGGGTDVDYYGYRYSDAAATQERRDINAFRFKDRFPAQFFASDEARRNDVNMHNALAAFEQANGVYFLRTDNTPSAVRLDPAGALYVFVVNETDGATLNPRGGTWCGDGIVQTATEECDDGNAVDNDLCHNDCTMGIPIPFGGPGENTGAKLSVGVRHLSAHQIANHGDNSITLMKFDAARNDENVMLTDLVFKAMTGSLDSLSNFRIWEDSNHDGAVDRPVGRVMVPSAGKLTFSGPAGWTGALIGSGGNILYELRADVPQSITDPVFQVALETSAASYVGGQRVNGSFPLVGIQTDGACSTQPYCTILVTTHPGIFWSFPVCGNSRVEAGETCDDGNTVSGDGCTAICREECIDPDGLDYYTRSTLMLGTNGYQDVCLDQTHLQEYFCPSDAVYGSQNYACPNGCQNGACIPSLNCGNGQADAGEECNEPGLTCGAGQTCEMGTCTCYTPASSASSSSAGNSSAGSSASSSANSSAGSSENSSVESSANSSGSASSAESSANSSAGSSENSSANSSAGSSSSGSGTSADLLFQSAVFNPLSENRGATTYLNFTVRNNSQDTTATNVTVTMPVPANDLIFAGGGGQVGVTCAMNPDQLICDLGNMAPGQVLSHTADFTVRTWDACHSATVTPQLTIQSDTTDPDTGNNVADLSFTATCSLCGNGVLDDGEECDYNDPAVPAGECDQTCHLTTPLPDY